MFDFIKKLFGFKPTQIEETVEIVKTASKRVKKLADVNKDGVVNVDDVKEIKKRVSKKVKEVADVNKDGKVDVDDLKEVLKKATKTNKVKKVVEKNSTTDEYGLQPANNPPPMPKVNPPNQTPKKRGRKPKAK